RLRQLHPGDARTRRHRARLRESEGEICQDVIGHILRSPWRTRGRQQRADTALLERDADPQRQTAQMLLPPPEKEAEALVDAGTRMLEIQVGRAASQSDLHLGIGALRGPI